MGKRIIEKEIIKAEMVMPHWNTTMYVHHITHYEDGSIVWYGDKLEKGKKYVFRACGSYNN